MVLNLNGSSVAIDDLRVFGSSCEGGNNLLNESLKSPDVVVNYNNCFETLDEVDYYNFVDADLCEIEVSKSVLNKSDECGYDD